MCSEIKIFSVFTNCKNFVEKKKSPKIDDVLNINYYNRNSPYVKSKVKEALRFMNNGFFDLKDFKTFMLYSYIYRDKMQWKDVKMSNIMACKTLFTKKQLDKDKEFILNLSKKVGKIKDINTFYRVNANGKNILLDLLLDKYISPFFYIRMSKYRTPYKRTYKVSDILKKIDRISLEMIKFV